MQTTTFASDTGTISEIAIDTLAGDVRDALLTRIRELNMPWSLMTQDKQSQIANGIDMTARDLVRAVVRLMIDHPFDHVVVRLGEVKIKGGDKGIEAKITCDNIEDNRASLGENVGQLVILYMADSEEFMAERAPAKIDPDQPVMPGFEEE